MLLDLSPLKKHHDFRMLFIGQLVSFFGSMITYVAIPYQLYELSKSSLLVGMLGTVQLVPLLFSALWGGALADAMDRRKLLIYSELLLAGAAIALAINSILPHPSIWVLFVLSAFMSAVNGFHRPALEAMTPKLVSVSDLPAVAALASLRYTIGAVAGPALGGLLIARFGVVSTYLIDFVTFAVSLLALNAIRSMPPAEGVAQPGLGSIAEGLRYAIKRPELIGTYVVDIIAMLFAMPMALFPAMSQSWGGADAAGWLYAAMPMGVGINALFSGWANKVKRHGAAVVIAATTWGIAVIALGFAQSLWLAVFFLMIAGWADGISGMFRQTIWNQTIPSSFRGRLAGVEMISYMSGPLLGNARAGWMATAWSNTFSITWGGVLCVIGVLACIPLLPRFWKYDASSQPSG